MEGISVKQQSAARKCLPHSFVDPPVVDAVDLGARVMQQLQRPGRPTEVGGREALVVGDVGVRLARQQELQHLQAPQADGGTDMLVMLPPYVFRAVEASGGPALSESVEQAATP